MLNNVQYTAYNLPQLFSPIITHYWIIYCVYKKKKTKTKTKTKQNKHTHTHTQKKNASLSILLTTRRLILVQFLSAAMYEVKKPINEDNRPYTKHDEFYS